MDFEYYIENGEVTIMGLKDRLTTQINIPEFINGYPVVKIGYDLLYSTINIVDVIIPTSILDVDSHALFNARHIRTINTVEIDHDKVNIINNRFVYYYNIFYPIKYQICDDYRCVNYNDDYFDVHQNVKYFIDNESFYSNFM